MKNFKDVDITFTCDENGNSFYDGIKLIFEDEIVISCDSIFELINIFDIENCYKGFMENFILERINENLINYDLNDDNYKVIRNDKFCFIKNVKLKNKYVTLKFYPFSIELFEYIKQNSNENSYLKNIIGNTIPQFTDKFGYKYIKPFNDNELIYIHRYMALYYLTGIGKGVKHLNGKINDNRDENLEWCNEIEKTEFIISDNYKN